MNAKSVNIKMIIWNGMISNLLEENLILLNKKMINKPLLKLKFNAKFLVLIEISNINVS